PSSWAQAGRPRSSGRLTPWQWELRSSPSRFSCSPASPHGESRRSQFRRWRSWRQAPWQSARPRHRGIRSCTGSPGSSHTGEPVPLESTSSGTRATTASNGRPTRPSSSTSSPITARPTCVQQCSTTSSATGGRWSYSPRVTAAELRRAQPDYPAALTRGDFFGVGRDVAMPAFGAQDRAGRVQGLLATNPDLYPYRPLAQVADEVAGRARTPYDAVARLEKWFLVSGRFRYSNRPPVISPPLVSFVTQTRAGYCQYFAGAMALMLRYLGIPARVAVGFAGGTYGAQRHA